MGAKVLISKYSPLGVEIMNITYRQLRDRINELTEDQLDLDASVYLQGFDETFSITDTDLTCENDVLGENYPVLIA